jgi:hypothetical protein
MPIMAGWKACPTKTTPAPERLNAYTAVLKFSRHTNINTLQFYLDRESRSQGKIADLVATASE